MNECAQPDSAVATLIEESLALERAGQIAAASARAEDALLTARTSTSAESLAAALGCVGFLRFRTGNYGQARARAEEALGYASPVSAAAADALLLLGMCATETCDLDAGEDCYLRAIALSRQLGYDRALLRGLHNLSAGVYVPRGQFDLAVAADTEAFQLARERGMPERAWSPLATLTWIDWLTNNPARARERVAELVQIVRPGSLGDGYVWLITGHLALSQGQNEEGADAYAHARAVADDLGSLELAVLARLGFSRHRRLVGDAAAALSWAADALTLVERAGYRHLHGIVLIERGRAAWALGEMAQAKADLQAAQAVLGPLQADFDLTRAAFFLAAILHEQGDPGAGPAWLDVVQRITRGGYAFLLEQERGLAFPMLATYLSQADQMLRAASTRLLEQLARVPPPPLHILTLGRFEVRQGPRPILEPAWRQRRAGELFRLLLIQRGRSLTREQVMEALWPEKPPAATNTPFHQATSALRHALEPDLPDKFPSRYLEVEGGRVALRLPPGSRVDFEAFEQHVRQHRWQDAVTRYEGDLFPDDRYADWAAAPRERLVRLFVEASLALAREALAAGDSRRSLAVARRVLEVEPWQESAVLAGMKACLALGDRAGAIRLYRDLERALRQDLGIAPQTELQGLYQTLRRV